MPTNQALAWGVDGHEVVGSIADQLLTGHPAKAKVASILGFELRVAAPWLDCIRSVVRHTDGTFEYTPNPHFHSPSCNPFETASEKARMEDYARRNWLTCVYKPGHGCHETYHFADVPVQEDHYDRAFAGTSKHDIVSAINAAIAILRNQRPIPPFSIKDQKEALFLLAHLLGDLHQPLHVGAVYLDSRGRRINPDDGSPLDPATETAGGNFLFDGSERLHSEWDDIPNALGSSANAAMMAAAAAVPGSSGQVGGWPTAWSSETIVASHAAFAGLTFTGHGHENWAVHFMDRPAYKTMQDRMQREQLAKAGARLAELLKAILP